MRNEKSFTWKTARVISDIFVPPTFVLFAFILIGIKFENSLTLKWVVILSGFVFGFLLPIVIFLFMRKHNLVANRDATIKEERTLPYIVGILLSLFAAGICYYAGASNISVALWLAYSGNTLLLILINKFWKISAHAIGSASPAGLLFYIYGNPGLWLFVLVFIIAWSRLKLRVHTPLQVTAGIVYGFGLTYLQLVYYVTLFH